MPSSKRIVLVDPLGDILFSGESLIAREADETCPETQRSAESGVFKAVSAGKSGAPGSVERLAISDAVTEAIYSDEAVPTQKRDPRAA